MSMIPTRCGYYGAGVSANEMPVGSVRDLSGAFVALLNLGTAKDILRAQRAVTS